MNKLYTAIFGVYISNPDDDFEKFINAVKSVIVDDDDTCKKKPCSLQSWIFFVIIFIILFISLVVLYLKLTQQH
ncbi:imv membrane protein [Pteropox virus]|uniref:Imv membrane protein n=1 Tax=Pteropox virus TaxID=1873698 RepID=A0A1B1MRE7_9POXV|nr:imv membrane protein [Pteropox virus]ANS71133.1 imv membrane protein [Pteropox virus]